MYAFQSHLFLSYQGQDSTHPIFTEPPMYASHPRNVALAAVLLRVGR
jgi:hypothetical protein